MATFFRSPYATRMVVTSLVLGLALLPTVGWAGGKRECFSPKRWTHQTWPGTNANQFAYADDRIHIKSQAGASFIHATTTAPLTSTLSWRWRSAGRLAHDAPGFDVASKERGDRRLAVAVGFKGDRLEKYRPFYSRLAAKVSGRFAPDVLLLYTWADSLTEGQRIRYEKEPWWIIVADARSADTYAFRDIAVHPFCDLTRLLVSLGDEEAGRADCLTLATTNKLGIELSAVGISADTDATKSTIESEISSVCFHE